MQAVPMIGSAAIGALMNKTPVGGMLEGVPLVGGLASDLVRSVPDFLTPGWNPYKQHPVEAVQQQQAGGFPMLSSGAGQLASYNTDQVLASLQEQNRKLQEELSRMQERRAMRESSLSDDYFMGG